MTWVCVTTRSSSTPRITAPETVTWPDGGFTPFHGEKGTTWEGGMRVPCLVRWPGVIQPGTIYNNIMSQEDWMPTLLAAAGVPGIVEKLEAGYLANGKTSKIHPDGYDFLPFFKSEVKSSPRDTIFYFGQGGELNAVRWNDWKISFASLWRCQLQHVEGGAGPEKFAIPDRQRCSAH